MRVGGGVVRDLGDARVGAGLDVDEDPSDPRHGGVAPRRREEGVGGVEPVVREGIDGGAGESAGCEGLCVEVFVLCVLVRTPHRLQGTSRRDAKKKKEEERESVC